MFLNSFTDLVVKFTTIVAVIQLVIALLQCFFGYKLLRFWVSVIGFIAGFLLGFLLSKALINGAPTYLPIIIGIVAGVLLSILAFKIYLAGVFIYCGLLAAGASMLIPYPSDQTWQVLSIVIAIAIFVVAGILAVKFSKPFIIVVTGISGATSTVAALGKLLPDLVADSYTHLAVLVVCAILGIAVQFLTTKDKKK